MTHDTLVFDIETQNFFTDPGVGWDNFEALKISVVGIYSYTQNKYFCFEESEIKEAAQFFRGIVRLVGFSINRYDIPVLTHYFQKLEHPEKLDLWKKERIDLLGEIEMATRERISLDKLAQANLGFAKTGHGAKAVELYQSGAIQELKSYCLKDVEITKALYDLYQNQHYLLVPHKASGEQRKVNFSSHAATSTKQIVSPGASLF